METYGELYDERLRLTGGKDKVKLDNVLSKKANDTEKIKFLKTSIRKLNKKKEGGDKQLAEGIEMGQQPSHPSEPQPPSQPSPTEVKEIEEVQRRLNSAENKLASAEKSQSELRILAELANLKSAYSSFGQAQPSRIVIDGRPDPPAKRTTRTTTRRKKAAPSIVITNINTATARVSKSVKPKPKKKVVKKKVVKKRVVKKKKAVKKSC